MDLGVGVDTHMASFGKFTAREGLVYKLQTMFLNQDLQQSLLSCTWHTYFVHRLQMNKVYNPSLQYL